jgi:hypothetical protein
MTSEFLNFYNLQIKIQSLYQLGDFETALDLVTQQKTNFPEHRQVLDYWGMVLSARIGKTTDTIRLFKGVLETGFWYAEPLLRSSPSLKQFKGNPEFEKLIDINKQLYEEDPTNKYPILTVRPEGQCVDNDSACPLLIALHANASNAQVALELWRTTASNGWLLAVPQSSQALWKGAYVWDDYQIAEIEIKHHFKSMISQYSTVNKRVVIAGISMGAEIAVRLTFTQSIPADGFVAINPTGPLPEELIEMRSNYADTLDHDLRGCILIGEKEGTLNFEDAMTLTDQLNQAGVECKLDKIPLNTDQSIRDFNETLLRSLQFISQ